jgi:hypothetical protein
MKSYYIALPIGFYCGTGRNQSTTSLRFATRFNSLHEAIEKGKQVTNLLKVDNFTVLTTVLGGNAS